MGVSNIERLIQIRDLRRVPLLSKVLKVKRNKRMKRLAITKISVTFSRRRYFKKETVLW